MKFVALLLFVGFVLVALGCGGLAAPHTERVGSIGREQTVDAMAEAPGGVVVFHREGLMARKTSVKVTRFVAGERSTVALGVGRIQAADSMGSEVWAIFARRKEEVDGSDYFLVVSQDGGSTWGELAPIPADSSQQVRIEGGGCGWVQGIGALLRTCNYGGSWEQVSGLGGIWAVQTPMVSTGAGQLVIGGQRGVHVTADSGATWVHAEEGRAVTALSGGWVAVRDDRRVELGRLESGKLTMTGHLPDDELLADGLFVQGDWVMVQATSIRGALGSLQYLYESLDGGVTFHRGRLGDTGHSERAVFGRGGTVWFVTWRGSVKRRNARESGAGIVAVPERLDPVDVTASEITKIEYESVASESDEAPHNHSWVLLSGGDFFYRKNARDAVRGSASEPYWFDGDYPVDPTTVVPGDRMAQILPMIEPILARGGTTLPDNGDTEHGGWDRLTITTSSRVVVIEVHSSHEPYMSDLVNPVLSLIYGT